MELIIKNNHGAPLSRFPLLSLRRGVVVSFLSWTAATDG